MLPLPVFTAVNSLCYCAAAETSCDSSTRNLNHAQVNSIRIIINLKLINLAGFLIQVDLIVTVGEKYSGTSLIWTP